MNNLIEMRSDWNFLKNIKNIFEKIKNKNWLTQQIIKKSKLKKTFINMQIINTATVEDRHDMIWKSNLIKK